MACRCARDGDVRLVGSRKRRQHQIWRDEGCVFEVQRRAEATLQAGVTPELCCWLARCTGRTGWYYYCAGRQASKQDEDVGAMARTSRQMDRRLVGMLCRLQSREGRK